MFDVLKLHKGIVALHFNPNQLTIGFKEHTQVISFCRLFVKVNDKERFRRLDAFAAIIFLALDSTVPTSKLGTKSTGQVRHFPGSCLR